MKKDRLGNIPGSQKKKNNLSGLKFLTFILVLFLLTGCHVEPNMTEPIPPIATRTAQPTPSPAPTDTPAPITLYLSESLPEGMLQGALPKEIVNSPDPEAALWFGPATEAPEGEVLHTVTWVYALAAPFPTLRDDLALEDLRSFWQGNPPENLDDVPQLYIPESFAHVSSLEWGIPSSMTVTRYDRTLPNVDKLWETNAWVILPFDKLDTRLKVISIDGISPLFKTYHPANDPLVHTYHLVMNRDESGNIPDTLSQSLIDLIPSINRDSEKLTTLVMTGVTALVRGTAYRMEQHGVLYPGEEIVHWLAEADLTHISNEVSFYQDCPFPDPAQESLFFCSDPRYIELLEFVGADIIELTGNHNNDMLYARGVDVVPFTLDLYDQYGMAYYGGGRDLAEATRPLLVTHNDNRLAFIGCNAFGPDFAWATEEQGGAAPCDDFQWMAAEVRRLRDEGYLPIATFQYFEDYYDFVVDHHIRDYAIMAEAGAVIINGSQAHRPKAKAFVEDAFIDYGLGNLFFDQRWYVDDYGNIIKQTSWVGIQRHTFYDNRHLSVELLTAMLENFAQPRPMNEMERQVFLDELYTASGWKSR